MGQRVLAFFEEADRMGGLVAKMRLASLAQVTSTEAASREDVPELVQRVEKALEQLRGEFSKEPQKGPVQGRIKAPAPGEDRTQILRRHLDTYLDLMAQRKIDSWRALEQPLTAGENLVQRFLKMLRGFREVLAHLLHVLLVTLLYFITEELLQRAGTQPFFPLVRVIHNHV